MWTDLSKYIKDKKVLEIGCGAGQKTFNIAKYANIVVGIDVSKENIDAAKRVFANNRKVSFLTLDASRMNFESNSFDVVITTDSFHEIEPNLQYSVLEEMRRLSKVIIFIEPDPVSVTNELFRVFDKDENHGLRITNSINKVFNYMNDNGYLLKKTNDYNDITTFKNEEEMYETLLDWWSDIKVPKDINEKNIMIKKIRDILSDFNMLEEMKIIEKIHYYVFIKE